MTISIQKPFTTTDTALAAWLYISNVRLLDTDTESSPSVRFIFEPPPEELLRDWNTGQAECVRFYRAYKYFLGLIKGRNGKV